MVSWYVLGLTTIVSPGCAALTACWIEPPFSTVMTRPLRGFSMVATSPRTIPAPGRRQRLRRRPDSPARRGPAAGTRATRSPRPSAVSSGARHASRPRESDAVVPVRLPARARSVRRAEASSGGAPKGPSSRGPRPRRGAHVAAGPARLLPRSALRRSDLIRHGRVLESSRGHGESQARAYPAHGPTKESPWLPRIAR